MEVKASTLGGHQVEACIAGVLEGATFPLHAMMELSDPVAGGPVAPPSRGLTAQVVEGAVVVSLAPIIITGAVVILFVTVVLHVTSQPSTTTVAPPMATTAPTTMPVTTAMPVPTAAPVSRKRKNACLEMFVDCQDKGYFCTRIRTDWGLSFCGLCRDECQAEKAYTHDECYRCGFQ